MFDPFDQLFIQYTSEDIQIREPQNLNGVEVSSPALDVTEVIIENSCKIEAEKLLQLYPTNKGGKLTIGLQDLLNICPRKRRRIDAFKTLRKYLKDNHSVDLHIVSRKDKYNHSKII